MHVATHGLGVLLSVAGLVWLSQAGGDQADLWQRIAVVVYCASLIATFLASTIYHLFHRSPRRHLFKLLDHCSIYLLIAGTYTPFLVIALNFATAERLLIAIWPMALVGIASKLWFGHRFPRLSMISYLLMGWLIVIAGPEVLAALGSNGITWLAAGGICYTIGAGFYLAKSMTYSHAIWHLFVLAGSACHFLTVSWYVLPGSDYLA